MRKSIKYIGLVLIFLLLAAVWLFLFLRSKEESYQNDAALKRINDVHKIAALLNEYKGVVGHYPFFYPDPPPKGYKKTPTMVTLAMDSAEQKLAKQPNPFGISVSRFQTIALVKELSDKLKRKVAIPVDPQKVPTLFPNAYYVFLLEEDEYVVLCFLYNPTKYSSKIAEHVNIYALSSNKSVELLKGMGLNPRYFNDFSEEERREIKINGEKADELFKKFSVIEVSE